MYKKIVLFLFVLLFLAASVDALGVTPARKTIGFAPGLSETVSFSVVNTEEKELNLVVSVQGDLAEHVMIDTPNVHLAAGQESASVSYTVNLPQSLEPGLNTAEIVVLQLPEVGELGETYVGAALAVVSQLHVHVPFPGKYIDVEIAARQSGSSVDFDIPVLSRGEFDCVSVKGSIDVFSPLNERVASNLQTNEISVVSKTQGRLSAQWDVAGVPPGPYRAVADVVCDDEKAKQVETQFNVGGELLSVIEIAVNDFSLGDIAKFEALVENNGAQDIDSAFLEIQVFDENGAVLDDFRSATQQVEAFSKEEMVLFWDTAGVKRGVYDAALVVHFNDIVDRHDIQLDISETSIDIIGLGFVIAKPGRTSSGFFESRTMVILIVLVIVLILINLSWFLWLRKKLTGRKRK